MNEQIDSITLFRETSCSWLYHIKARGEYILKKSKQDDISEEFDNHRKIYECWFGEKENLEFKIPKIYFLGNDKKFYLMEYIKGGVNFLEVLFENRDDTDSMFRRAGECVNQYHIFATKYLAEHKESILAHNTIRQLLNTGTRDKIRNCLAEFGDDTYRIIFKDFTPFNVIFDRDKNIYFLDFHKIYYYAPFYYDLARFIDTGKVFSLVRKPLFFLFNSKRINYSLQSFLDGYDSGLDKAHLRKMQCLHRREHVQMKVNKNKLNSLILRLVYHII